MHEIGWSQADPVVVAVSEVGLDEVLGNLARLALGTAGRREDRCDEYHEAVRDRKSGRVS